MSGDSCAHAKDEGRRLNDDFDNAITDREATRKYARRGRPIRGTQESLFDIPDVLPPPDWSGEWSARVVNTPTAAGWITKWHYIGAINPSSIYYGAFAPDMIAVAGVGQPGNVAGVAGLYDLTAWKGNLEITRVVCHPHAPKNTASRALALVLALLRADGVEWVFSYADTGQNHHGGIYQALNAVYVGASAPRHHYLIDGEHVHPRTMVSRYGSHGKAKQNELRAAGHEISEVEASAKHTYILPIGSAATRFAIRCHLKPRVRPYPKREVAQEASAPSAQEGSTGSTPVPRFGDVAAA